MAYVSSQLFRHRNLGEVGNVFVGFWELDPGFPESKGPPTHHFFAPSLVFSTHALAYKLSSKEERQI